MVVVVVVQQGRILAVVIVVLVLVGHGVPAAHRGSPLFCGSGTGFPPQVRRTILFSPPKGFLVGAEVEAAEKKAS